MRIYATAEDLAEWTSEAAPGNASKLLRAASLLVERATRRAVYSVDSEGLPTDPAAREAFRDATTAQAAFWADQGINPSLGVAGVKPVVSGKSMSGVSVSYQIDPAVAAARINAVSTLCLDAHGVLQTAGLLDGSVRVI